MIKWKINKIWNEKRNGLQIESKGEYKVIKQKRTTQEGVRLAVTEL